MIAARIKDYISKLGLDINSIASNINMPVKTLAEMLNGDTKLTAETYFYLCNALNVPITQFMG